jgi:rRNA maturation protein Nop10
MAKLVRCKACGYITEEGKLKDVCPACGVPAKMFEPFTDPVSEKRRKLLGMHIHPIIVHFPQAFAFSLFVLAVSSSFVGSEIKVAFHYTIQVIAFFLPIVVLLSLSTGLLDAKTRFKRLNTPFLKIKIITGSAFFIVSIILAVVVLARQPAATSLLIVLSILATGCSFPLGIIGTKLTEAKLPG